jgi:phosphatidylglycerophosphatase A
VAGQAAAAARGFMKNFLIKTFVSVFGLGHLPYAPGTWGTFGAFIFWQLYFKNVWIVEYIFVVVILSILGIYFSGLAERIYKVKDSQHIVIDEFCGYLVSMIMVPTGIFWGIAGFILFRLFDIFKPVPIRQLEKLPLGLGVMADDLMAGVYVVVILNVARYFISYLLI